MFKLTENAIIELKRLSNNQYLRVGVIGGGCSGMQYDLELQDNLPSETDKIIDEGFKVVIDAKSILFLNETTLDFSSGLNGKGFEFHNASAKRTCGCGSSFSC